VNLGRGGRGEGWRKYSGIMSGGKPVLVFVMYSLKARTRRGSDHRVASCPSEETCFSRRSRSLDRAGQVRIACWNVSGSVSQRGQVRLGSSSNQEGWAAR